MNAGLAFFVRARSNGNDSCVIVGLGSSWFSRGGDWSFGGSTFWSLGGRSFSRKWAHSSHHSLNTVESGGVDRRSTWLSSGVAGFGTTVGTGDNNSV